MIIVIEIIKSIFNFKKIFDFFCSNKFVTFILMLTFHICTQDKDIKSKLEHYLFKSNGTYDIIKLVVVYLTKLLSLVILLCLIFSLIYKAVVMFSNDDIDRYEFLLIQRIRMKFVIVPFSLALYFLLIIISVKDSWYETLTYVIKQIPAPVKGCFLGSLSIATIIACIYNIYKKWLSEK